MHETHDTDQYRFVAHHTYEGQRLLFEGMVLVLGKAANEEPLQPDDIYIAARNSGTKLLTCAKMGTCSEPGWGGSWVAPKEDAYYYDTFECRKVVCIKDVE